MKMTITERLRSQFQNPFDAVKKIGVAEGMKVADIGAGQGYLTIPTAEVVGKTGLVYSVEPDPKRSNRIKARVESEGLSNVKVIVAKAESLGDVPSGGVDLAFSAFSIHHFEDRKAALAEVRRILRDGGTFYVWDRVPGRIVRWGTHPEDLRQIADGFKKFEQLETQKAIRAKFTK